ncbi:TadE family protein [Leptospira interrogans]
MFRQQRIWWNAARRSVHTLLFGEQGTSGSALVELAIFAPILVTLTLYTIDLGAYAFRKMEVQYAAQAGAQYAIGKAYDSSAVNLAVSKATGYSSSITPSSSEFCGCPTATGVTFCAASCDVCNTGTCAVALQGHYVSVTAGSTSYTPLAPFKTMTGTRNISATSTVRIR